LPSAPPGPILARARLGSSDLLVARWCLGCNPFGWTVDERQAFAVLDAYVAAGGNFLDTSDTYPPGSEGGTSERILGRWLRASGSRDQLVVATKVGGPLPGGHVDLSPKAIHRRARNSLRRLGVDHVDLLYAHLDDEATPLEETLGALDELVRAGLVRAIGASNFSAPRLARALEISRREGLAHYVALQTHYNLLERSRILDERASVSKAYEGPLAELCEREGIGVVPYWALAKGFLTGKYRSGDVRDDGASFSDRARVHRPRSYLDPRGAAVLDALDEIAAARATNVAAIALAWTVSRPAVVATVASARTVGQIAELAVMLGLELSEDERRALLEVSD
jgi:aryl-alcohol dehydrogenase-like predicted oxidoreductase